MQAFMGPASNASTGLGGSMSDNATAVVVGGSFDTNTATSELAAGAIYAQRSTITVSDSSFANNVADFLFFLPWMDHTVVGTTDSPCEKPTMRPQVQPVGARGGPHSAGDPVRFHHFAP